jgi:hypothetical protein
MKVSSGERVVFHLQPPNGENLFDTFTFLIICYIYPLERMLEIYMEMNLGGP